MEAARILKKLFEANVCDELDAFMESSAMGRFRMTQFAIAWLKMSVITEYTSVKRSEMNKNLQKIECRYFDSLTERTADLFAKYMGMSSPEVISRFTKYCIEFLNRNCDTNIAYPHQVYGYAVV